tara:strand:- start:384 stop:545 length:162 start_codon:yes stop_codon:yes gene_type:complete
MNELRNGNQKLEKEIEELKSEHATVVQQIQDDKEAESQVNLRDFHSTLETKEA